MFSQYVVCLLFVFCSCRHPDRERDRWRRKGCFWRSGGGLLADHIHGVAREGGHAVDNIQRCDGVTVIKRQHAAFKIPAEGWFARPDVDRTTIAAVEIDVSRAERLLDACGIDDGDLDGWL